MLHHDNVMFWLFRLHSQKHNVTDDIEKIKNFYNDPLSHVPRMSKHSYE